MIKILTEREKAIIEKKTKGISLTQNESNILSKYVRPKLREITKLNAETILNRIEYNQIAKSIENKIKKIVLDNIKNAKAVVLYGSAIQTNYKNYNDIDVLILTKNKMWKNNGDKYNLIEKLTKFAKEEGLNLDIQIIDEDSFYYNYPQSPSLIYQLKDCKAIHGRIKSLKKIELTKLDLRMKLDWSDIDDEKSNGKEIYNSMRNALLVKLLLRRIIDNDKLNEQINEELGSIIANKLKNDLASRLEKKIVINYIQELSKRLDEEIRRAKWEKIML